MASPAVQQDGRVRRRILVQGVVQGVGFRPFVYSTATELLLSGSVSNSSAGVVVEVEGAAPAVAAFERLLVEQPPPLAIIAAVDALDVRPCGDRPSQTSSSLREASTRSRRLIAAATSVSAIATAPASSGAAPAGDEASATPAATTIRRLDASILLTRSRIARTS